MRASTKPRTKQLPSELPHIKAAEFWRQCGRNNRKTAEESGVHRDTVAEWIEREGWIAWADARDSEDAETVRIVSLQSAVQHSLEMDALIAGTRALAQAKFADVSARLQGIASPVAINVDDDELLTVAKLVQAASAVGASKYGAAPVTSVNVQIDTTQAAEQAKDRLQQWLKEHRALPGEARA